MSPHAPLCNSALHLFIFISQHYCLIADEKPHVVESSTSLYLYYLCVNIQRPWSHRTYLSHLNSQESHWGHDKSFTCSIAVCHQLAYWHTPVINNHILTFTSVISCCRVLAWVSWTKQLVAQKRCEDNHLSVHYDRHSISICFMC